MEYFICHLNMEKVNILMKSEDILTAIQKKHLKRLKMSGG